MKIVKLNLDEIGKYKNNYLKNFVYKYLKSDTFLVLAAVKDDLIIGIICVETFVENKDSLIKKIFVDEDHRNAGIGSLLIKKSEDYLKELGIKNLHIQYFKENVSEKFFDFIDRNFSENEFSFLVCKGDSSSYKPKWLQFMRFPKDFSYFMWKDITKQQIESLNNDPDRKDWEDLGLYPIKEDENVVMAEDNSVGLLYKDEIVGWMIPHMVGKDALIYSSYYIKPRFRKNGAAIALFNVSLNKRTIDNAYFRVPAKLKEHIGFVKKNMLKYLIYAKHKYVAYKII